MDLLITPHALQGTVHAIPSKSMAHRLLMLASLASGTTDIVLPSGSEDIDATLRCVSSLGAYLGRTQQGYRIVPITVRGARSHAQLDVGESGSTLRFLLPIVAALGCGAVFTGHGRLAQRPLSPLDSELKAHGINISNASDGFPLEVSGSLTPGHFSLPGNVSSQFVSGLLLAAPLIDGDVTIDVEEPIESKPYIDLTVSALDAFGVAVHEEHARLGQRTCRRYIVTSAEKLVSPGSCTVEGDWSNASFWLAAGALQDTPLFVAGLDPFSRQGDRAIMSALTLLGARIGRSPGMVAASRDQLHGQTIDVSGIPDLAAPLALVASVSKGTTLIVGASRLRLKESDRLVTIRDTLNALGGNAAIANDELIVEGVERLAGGVVDASGDHRIAMMACVGATYATNPTMIRGAECVAKSYPSFYDDFRSLGGIAHEKEA